MDCTPLRVAEGCSEWLYSVTVSHCGLRSATQYAWIDGNGVVRGRMILAGDTTCGDTK